MIASQAQFIEVEKQQAADAAALDNFGVSVAISDNWEIVGAFGKDNNTGKVYLFERGCNQTWTQAQELEAPMPSRVPGANFGRGVAIHGDRAMVGAPGEDGNRGAVYIFERNPTSNTWSQDFRMEGVDQGDLFGYSVAIGDIWALVGAPRSDEGSTRSGGVHVLEYDGAWREVARLKAPVPQYGSTFGYAVSITPSGEWALIGAYKYRNGDGDNVGAAYFFNNAGGQWNQAPQVLVGTGEHQQQFGLSVAISDEWAIIGEWYRLGPKQARLDLACPIQPEWLRSQHFYRLTFALVSLIDR